MRKPGASASVFAFILLAVPVVGALTPTTRPATPAVDVRVDGRVELFSIIFRLADNKEYSRGSLGGYDRDIQQQFGPLKDHPVVQLARRLRQTQGVGFDAPMSLAVQLKDAEGLELNVPLDPWPDGIDSRWKPDDVRQFLKLARDFVDQSHFDQFLKDHASLYDESARRMNDLVRRKIRLEWFDSFFGGAREVDFHLIVGLCNGPGNYGTHSTRAGRAQLYAIIGAGRGDKSGVPVFADSYIAPIIIHEFCHSWCNPLINAHYDQLRDAGEKLFAGKEPIMRSQAYSSGRTVLYETLVRACVARYRFDNDGQLAGAAEVLQQRLCGFEWTGEVNAALADYELHRDQYPTLDTFMPRIARCLHEYELKDSGR